jgi:hypothetical protein
VGPDWRVVLFESPLPCQLGAKSGVVRRHLANLVQDLVPDLAVGPVVSGLDDASFLAASAVTTEQAKRR